MEIRWNLSKDAGSDGMLIILILVKLNSKILHKAAPQLKISHSTIIYYSEALASVFKGTT